MNKCYYIIRQRISSHSSSTTSNSLYRTLCTTIKDEPLEKKILNILSSQFQPTKIKVTDTSGGCGAMFDINIESSKFTGKPLVQQHKMVTNAIKAEIKSMHGLTLKTRPSPIE